MIELLTPAEMTEADRLAIAGGVPGIALMERAGGAVADAVAARAGYGRPVICVVAGPGNNGGDGFVAARILSERGYRVQLLLQGARERLTGDAAIAASRWTGPLEAAAPEALAGADLIVDALFGAGLARDIEGEPRALIEAINARGVPVIAVDLPSGIDGGTGQVRGVAVRAAESVTFFRRKPGHLLLPGRIHCGRVTVHDIGIPDAVLERIGPSTLANDPALWGRAFPVPAADGHKYSRGHAIVVSGGLSSTGAARLSARAALRAGAGLVTLASPPEALAVNAAASLSVMVRRMEGADGLAEMLADRRINALVLGPGGGVGRPLRDMVLAALRHGRATVLDADALTSFADDPEELFSPIRSNCLPTILTPHTGEFHRLFAKSSFIIEKQGKIELARAAATASGAVVVLKGPDTVVASPDSRAAVTDNAPPWLATAGSGDVLAGLAGGLLAQGMPGFEAACAAVWLHGEAGQEAGPGLIAEDLPDVLPEVYRRLFAGLGTQP